MARRVWWVPAVLVATGCAARVFTPPAGPAEPFADAALVWQQATASCRGAQRFVAEIRVNGWVGTKDQRIAPTLHGAVTRDDDVYLEYPAPGGPVLQMAGRAGDATFLLPRDTRVLRDRTRNIVAALTGLQWGGRELLDVLSGCVAAPDGPVTGERIGQHLKVALSPTTRVWLREYAGQWRVRAAEVEGWLVEYEMFNGSWPSDVRVTSQGATPLDLRFLLAQVQVNIPLPVTTFTLTVPDHFQVMTIEELRSIGPLRDRQSPIPDSDSRFPIQIAVSPISNFR
jgi:hypothetical protein